MKYLASTSAILIMLGQATAAPTGARDSRDDSVAQLQQMVRQLQNQVDELKAQHEQNWLTEKRTEEIKALVQDVLADADTRASLLQSGAVAGWDKGFFIASADGNYKLRIGGQFQIRFVYNHQDDSPVDDDRWGFENRRSKIIMQGHVVDPTWTFDIQFAAHRATGVVMLEDAGWIQKDLGDGWKVRVGQQKAPFLREETLSSQRMLAIERSLLNSTFTTGTVQGAQLAWEGDRFRALGMIHDGPGSANTPWSMEDTEAALSGRVEWLASGEWKNLADYNSFKDEDHGAILGAAVTWSKAEFGTGVPLPFNNAESEIFGLTADATIDFGGASLSGAIVYRQIDADVAGVSLDQWGFLIRGGVFLSETWELYAQYEWASLDVPAVEDLSVLTVGVTKYWAKHSLKWQSDIGFGFDNVDALFANDGAGWRADAPGGDGQIVLRSQIQLVF